MSDDRTREELIARIDEQDAFIDLLLARCANWANRNAALEALLAEKKPTPEALAGNWPLVDLE